MVGRLDAGGRLVSADPELEALQREAGSGMGKQLALPQVAAVADLARTLGTAVSRPAIAAAADHDVELWVSAAPDGDQILLTLEGWTVRPPAAPRLAAILGGGGDATASPSADEWSADEELRIIALSPGLAERLGVDPLEAAGAPLTCLVRLEEGEDGDMPLIAAAATRRGFSGQRARSRHDRGTAFVLSGDVVTGADGAFAGFRGKAVAEQAAHAPARHGLAFDGELDELLRSPVDRIIETADRIAAGADGPLREDYASYGNDIASAARHLMSVLRSMSEDPSQGHDVVDLAGLSAEAVIMLESSAEERGVTIDLGQPRPLRVRGQERGVIQIVVNLIVNALRHSPEGGTVRLSFASTAGTASVTVSDEGPGISPGDEQRIFERFERGDAQASGTGLGLAISRRLARSMGGDVTLDSSAGEGARFTLTLPAA
ncbi:MAG TPA: HAMP domain-containing sensor histidine kinase [Sphingomicrobium sp.]